MKENLKNKNNISMMKKTKNPFPLLIFSVAFSLFFLVVAQLSLLNSFAAVADTIANPVPVINFREESWDFGEITPDELPDHIFKFRNTGDEVLIIKEVKVSCESCTDVLISTKNIAPGKGADLKITVNSLNMRGKFSKRIYIYVNDPKNPLITLTVSGFIKDKKESVSDSDTNTGNISPQKQTETPYMTGMSYLGKGEYEKAIPEFEKSIKLNPNHTDSYYYLGQSYLQMGIIEYNKKHIFKAYSLYRRANKVAEQVIPLYEKTIEDNPEDLNSYLRLGYIYETKSMAPFVNEYDKALKYYSGALSLDSVSKNKNLGIYIYLNTRIGIINYQEKDYFRAIGYLEKIEKISSYQPGVEVYYYLGMSYNKKGEKEKAVSSFSQVIDIAPQSEFAKEAEKEIKKIN